MGYAEGIKELFSERMYHAMREIDAIAYGSSVENLVLNRELGNRFMDAVAKMVGYRYLYHFIDHPESDPIGLSKFVIPGLESLREKPSREDSHKVIPIRRCEDEV